jgi:hypothetical protein
LFSVTVITPFSRHCSNFCFFFFYGFFSRHCPDQKGGTGEEGPGRGKLDGCIMHQVHISNTEYQKGHALSALNLRFKILVKEAHATCAKMLFDDGAKDFDFFFFFWSFHWVK